MTSNIVVIPVATVYIVFVLVDNVRVLMLSVYIYLSLCYLSIDIDNFIVFGTKVSLSLYPKNSRTTNQFTNDLCSEKDNKLWMHCFMNHYLYFDEKGTQLQYFSTPERNLQ